MTHGLILCINGFAYISNCIDFFYLRDILNCYCLNNSCSHTMLVLKSPTIYTLFPTMIILINCLLWGHTHTKRRSAKVRHTTNFHTESSKTNLWLKSVKGRDHLEDYIQMGK
jgi:hypothetical protein